MTSIPTMDVDADLAAATVTARRYLAAQVADGGTMRRMRRANAVLVGEMLAIIAATYAVIYAAPWPLALALIVPWSIASALVLDNAVHYLNHWPPFRREWANALWRVAGLFVFFNPMEIRYYHWEHHRGYDLAGEATWRWVARECWTSIAGLAPWDRFGLVILELRRKKPAHFREIVAMRIASYVWLAALLWLAPLRTLVLFVPAILIIGPVCSVIMNVTDHHPGTAAHPFRQATWLEPRTPGERVVSAVNHYTAATHLTHHLFPQVHWIHIRELQAELAPLYVAHEAPRSLIINSTLLGNPLRLFAVVREVVRR